MPEEITDYRRHAEAVLPSRIEIAINFLMSCDGNLKVCEVGPGNAISIIKQWTDTLPKEKITRGE